MAKITSDMTVEYVLAQWPETVAVFNQDLRTACVGCVMAPFDTLADIARIYEMDLERILLVLQGAVDQTA
jgi:hybrid cluster-associated redox disulfide protein